MIITIAFFWYVIGFIGVALAAWCDEVLTIGTLVLIMSIWPIFIIALPFIVDYGTVIYKSKRKQADEILRKPLPKKESFIVP